MTLLLGFVDSRRRPMVSLKVGRAGSSGGDLRTEPADAVALLALVDTGFNGELWMGRDVAEALDVRIGSVFADAELADGRVQAVHVGSVELLWLGRRRATAVFIGAREHGALRVSRLVDTTDGERYVTSRPGEPVALVGTGLIHPDRLTIDFLDGTVTIGAWP